MTLRARSVVLAAVLALACASGPSSGAYPRPVPRTWDRGFNFTTWSPDSYASPAAVAALRDLRATGANAIALIPTWYQASPTAVTIAPDGNRSPTDRSIATIVGQAKALGLKVFLRPQVDDEGDTPRYDFHPSSLRAWFASYRRFIYHYARLADALGVDLLSVGAEYHRLDGPRDTARWLQVIAGVRRRFHGPLTYGANSGDAWDQIGFWRALDVIGIDAYFALTTPGTPAPGVATIVDRWRTFTDQSRRTYHYLGAMRALAARYHKWIVFTEVGYPSTTQALVQPWAPSGSYTGEPQRRAFEALFRAFSRECWFRGMYIWDWRTNPTAGGPGDADYTPQRKPAQATISRWYHAIGSVSPSAGPRGRCAW
jgi:hypothetical protein